MSKSPKAQPRLTWRASRAGWRLFGDSVRRFRCRDCEIRCAGLCADTLGLIGFEFGIDLPGDQKDVGVAVVVEIEQAHAPTDESAFVNEPGAVR